MKIKKTNFYYEREWRSAYEMEFLVENDVVV